MDANILVYSSDTTSSHHADAVRLLEDLASGPELLRLFWPVLMAYLRISTHPSVFASPLTPNQAMANIEALISLSHVVALGEVDGFWDIYKDTTSDLVVRGNLVTDAHIVSLMRQHGVNEIWTKDRDLAKFKGIRSLDPAERS